MASVIITVLHAETSVETNVLVLNPDGFDSGPSLTVFSADGSDIFFDYMQIFRVINRIDLYVGGDLNRPFTQELNDDGTFTFVASDNETLTLGPGISDATGIIMWTASGTNISDFAEHIIGLSDRSVTITFDDNAPGNVPAQPDSPTLATLSTSSIRATFTDPDDDGGSVITSRNLRYRETDTIAWTTLTGIASPRTVTGLSSGTEYEFQVQVVNSIGESEWSDSGINATNVVVDSSNNDILIVGFATSSVYRYSNGSWDSGFAIPLNEDFPLGLTVDPTNGDILIVGADNDRVYRYSNGSWDSGFAIPSNEGISTGIAIDSNGDILIVGGSTGRIFRYSNGSWDGGFAIPSNEHDPLGMAVDPTNGDILIVGGSTGRVYRY